MLGLLNYENRLGSKNNLVNNYNKNQCKPILIIINAVSVPVWTVQERAYIAQLTLVMNISIHSLAHPQSLGVVITCIIYEGTKVYNPQRYSIVM